MIRVCLVFVLGIFPMLAWADCLSLSSSTAKAIARQISTKVRSMGANSQQPLTLPTLLLKTVDHFDPTDTSALSGGTARDRDELAAVGCIDSKQAIRSIMVAAENEKLPLAFVSPDTDAYAKEAADRINRIGYDAIDEKTVSDLKVRKINYVVVLGGSVLAIKKKCSFMFRFNADVEIHSLESLQVVAMSYKGYLSDGNSGNIDLMVMDGNYLEIIPDASNRRLILRSKIDRPICLGNVAIHVDYQNWSQNIGCISGYGEASIRPTSALSPNYWANSGNVDITPDDSCGDITADNIPINAVFGQLQNSSMPPLSRFPSGTLISGCSCKPMAPAGYVNLAQCTSRQAFNDYSCPFISCAPGNVVYTTRCL